jgi:arachidonate 5-lipoxygenase
VKYTEADLLNALPDKPATLDTMVITTILSEKSTNSLGDFEVNYIFEDKAREILKK